LAVASEPSGEIVARRRCPPPPIRQQLLPAVHRAMSGQDLSTPESNQANNGQPRPLYRHFAKTTLHFLI
jgi:hypothetical protein